MRQTEKEQKDSEKGKQEDKEFLRTEPLGKLLLKLALPTVAAQGMQADSGRRLNSF